MTKGWLLLCLRRSVVAFTCLWSGAPVLAQTPDSVKAASKTPQVSVARPGRPVPVVSPEIATDGRVTFRVFALEATSVTVGGDINQGLERGASAEPPGSGHAVGISMTKGPDGVWSGTSALPMRPGAWRYHFVVDGMTVVDSNNVEISPFQAQMESLLIVPGDFSETRNVPHGAVAQVHYEASTFHGATREMFVYTPPGYEKGNSSYPVLYLIHGGGETAASWSTVGRANDILDNLVAEGKAVPMIIVMPSGWTPLGRQVMTANALKDPFNDEMMNDILPFIQTHYCVKAAPGDRALSGLSMGGIQTLNIGLHNLGTFRYLVVMSSGWVNDTDRNFFFNTEAARIPSYNSQLKLFWWGWGVNDIARPNAILVTDRLKSLGVHLETMETPDGHEWKNWRLYLHETAPKLFR